MRRRVMIGKEFKLSVLVEESANIESEGEESKTARHVAVGNEFDAKVSDASKLSEAHEAITRSRLVAFVFVVCAIFLVGAGIVGLCQGQYGALEKVWNAVYPIYAGIAGYFFRAPSK